jgi:predicted permease
MDNFVLILVAITIGYGINRLNIFSKEAPIILNQFVIYISLPAMVLLQIPKLTFSIDTIIPIVVAWACYNHQCYFGFDFIKTFCIFKRSYRLTYACCNFE